MDEVRCDKIADMLQSYTVKKMKQIINYPDFYGLLEIYLTSIETGLYIP